MKHWINSYYNLIILTWLRFKLKRLRSKLSQTLTQKIFIYLYEKNTDLEAYKIHKIGLYLSLYFILRNEDNNSYKQAVKYLEPCDLEKLIHEIANNEEINATASKYYSLKNTLLDLYIGELKECEIKENNYFANKHHLKIEKFNLEQISTLQKWTVNENKNSKNTLNNKKESHLKNKIEKSTNKIKITPSTISFITSLLAGLFLITGYLYTKLYLNHFNIDASNFFTLSDYLSSSIDKLSIIFISLIIMTLSYFLGLRDRIEDNIYAKEFDINSKNIIHPYTIVIFILIINGSQLLFTYLNNEIEIALMTFQLLILSLLIISKLPIKKYFEDDSIIRGAILLIAILLITVNQEAYKDMKEITSQEKSPHYFFEFKNETNIERKNYQLISTTASNYFLYDLKSRSTLIIQRSDVILIRTKNDTHF